MSGERLDRTLSEDPKSVLWLDEQGAYHEVTREEPLMTDCGMAPDPERDDLNHAAETLALQSGHQRCGTCEFEEPLGLYVEGAKEFHRPVEMSDGVDASACTTVASTRERQDVVSRGLACLLFNGIDPCLDCWSVEDGKVVEPVTIDDGPTGLPDEESRDPTTTETIEDDNA